MKTAEISEVDGILAELQLQEGAKTIAVETKQSSLHFDDGGDALRIYVPRDQIQQQKCYVEALPRRLCEWLAGDGIKREASLESMRCKNIVMQILMVPHGIICSILDDAGIINIDIIDDFQPPVTQESIQNTSLLSQGQAPATESITTLSGGHQEPIALDGEVSNSDSVASVDKTITAESAVSAVSETSIATMPICQQPGDDTQSGASGSSVCYSSSLRTISSSYRHSSLSNLGPDNLGPPSTPFTYSPGRSEQVLVEPACAPDYIALLSQVINNASRAMLPRNDAYDFNRIRCALDQLDDHDDFAERIRFSTSSKLERDKMIGAAGELFVSQQSNVRPLVGCLHVTGL